MAKYDTIIINEELFKKYSPITDNCDITDFFPYILIAQEIYLTEVLGEALIGILKDEIEGNNLSEANSALIIKIAPCLSLYAVYQGLPFLWAKFENKGVTVKSSENSKEITMKDLSQLRLFLQNDAERFKELLIKFLCKCIDDYPLWNPYNEDCCNRFNKNSFGSNKKSFDSGVFFPKKVNNCDKCGC